MLVSIRMRLLITLLLLSSTALATDETVALALRAQSDFDRVELAAVPVLTDTMACVQSQAMILPVTRPVELSLIYYRKAYCELAAATISRKPQDYRGAARDFEKAEEVWPQPAKKNAPPVPVSSGLRVLADISHLLADGNTDPRVNVNLEAAVTTPECSGTDMSVARCQEMIQTGRLWLGWAAAREGRLPDAAQWFEHAPNLGWSDWVAGRRAMNDKKFPQAVAAFRNAEKMFSEIPASTLEASIRPRPDLSDVEFRLGTAQFETKDYASAEASFDRAVNLRPENARAIYLRGLSKEFRGQSGLSDYDLASRTAFANVNAPGASGQAHLYRGVALYRRKDFPRAEQEFSSALNFDSGQAQDDAAAWRHMAAVAGGACGASAVLLEHSLTRVSDFFPKQEAAAMARNCRPRAVSEIINPPEF